MAGSVTYRKLFQVFLDTYGIDAGEFLSDIRNYAEVSADLSPGEAALAYHLPQCVRAARGLLQGDPPDERWVNALINQLAVEFTDGSGLDEQAIGDNTEALRTLVRILQGASPLKSEDDLK